MFKIIDKYIADVIDPKISFTPTITLQQDFNFREKIYKLVALINHLRFATCFYLLFTVWMLYDVED